MFRSAYSFIPQSTTGDLLNKSLVKFYELYGEEYSLLANFMMLMYDDVPESKIQDCITKMKSCMTWELVINGETCIVDRLKRKELEGYGENKMRQYRTCKYKSKECFYKNTGNSTGYSKQCKSCSRQYAMNKKTKKGE